MSSTLSCMALQMIIYIHNVYNYINTGTNVKHTDWYGATNDCI